LENIVAPMLNVIDSGTPDMGFVFNQIPESHQVRAGKLRYWHDVILIHCAVTGYEKSVRVIKEFTSRIVFGSKSVRYQCGRVFVLFAYFRMEN
jgi:hypothetical protein